jgi:thioredoxin 1
MDRRTFLLGVASAAFVPLSAVAGESFVNYSPGVIENALSQGKTVLVDYWASWCSTCRRQGRVMDELRAQNPAYNANIVFIRVDWDQYKQAEVTTSRAIPRRSTLVLLRGNKELGRIVAGTRRRDIKALLDKGLQPSA